MQPGGKRAARSQIEFSDKLLEVPWLAIVVVQQTIRTLTVGDFLRFGVPLDPFIHRQRDVCQMRK